MSRDGEARSERSVLSTSALGARTGHGIGLPVGVDAKEGRLSR
jgi:hypothetical protein